MNDIFTQMINVLHKEFNFRKLSSLRYYLLNYWTFLVKTKMKPEDESFKHFQF